MVEINSTINTKPDPAPAAGKQWDVKSLLEKVLELQDLLMQAQEKNLLLSTQVRELERTARDADDLKAELSAQGLVLADKTRENKMLHQEFSRSSGLLDVKLQEIEEAKAVIADLEQQVKSKEQERDIVLEMLNELETVQKRSGQSLNKAQLAAQEKEVKDRAKAKEKEKEQMTTGSWLRYLKGA